MKTFIILVVAIGISAVVGAIVIGTRSFEGTVVQEPYEKGLKYDEERKFRESLGYQLNVESRSLVAGKKGNLTFMVLDKGGRPVDLGAPEHAMRLRFTRPTSDKYDLRPAWAALGGGVIGVSLELPEPGLWDMSVELKATDRSVVLEKRITIKTAE